MPAAETPVVQLDLSVRQERQHARHVFCSRELPGGLPGKSKAARSHGSPPSRRNAPRRSFFWTKRPRTAGATAEVQSQRWLEARGFPLPSVFSPSKDRVAGLPKRSRSPTSSLTIGRKNCLDVITESSARAILVWRGSSEATAARVLASAPCPPSASVSISVKKSTRAVASSRACSSASAHAIAVLLLLVKSLASPSTPSSSKS